MKTPVVRGDVLKKNKAVILVRPRIFLVVLSTNKNGLAIMSPLNNMVWCLW